MICFCDRPKRATDSKSGGSVLCIMRARQSRTIGQRYILASVLKSIGEINQIGILRTQCHKRQTVLCQIIGQCAHMRIVNADNARPRRFAIGKELRFSRRITGHIAMPVQMVGREVEPNADIDTKAAVQIKLIR